MFNYRSIGFRTLAVNEGKGEGGHEAPKPGFEFSTTTTSQEGAAGSSMNGASNMPFTPEVMAQFQQFMATQGKGGQQPQQQGSTLNAQNLAQVFGSVPATSENLNKVAIVLEGRGMLAEAAVLRGQKFEDTLFNKTKAVWYRTPTVGELLVGIFGLGVAVYIFDTVISEKMEWEPTGLFRERSDAGSKKK